MGLIQQTNAEYYTGSDIQFYTDVTITGIDANLEVILEDTNSSQAGNYKIFVDPTGSAHLNNFIEYPSFATNGLSNQGTNSLLFNWSATSGINATQGSYIVSITGGGGQNGLLGITINSAGDISQVDVLNAGDDYVENSTITIPGGALGPGSSVVTAILTNNNLYNGPTYQVQQAGSNIIYFPNAGIPGPVAPYTQVAVKVQLNQNAIWDQYGSYEYISIDDIVDNFLVGYVGEGKLLERVKRSDIIFHAKRGLQEFSYDTLRSVKSQELQLTPVCSAVIPQDYINYVQISWVDGTGVKHPIYPTTLTSSPTQPLIQDGQDGQPIQDAWGQNIEAGVSNTQIGWDTNNNADLNGLITVQDLNANIYNWTWWDQLWGQRYGLEPEVSNMNGWFNIDRRRNTFNFSSNLKGKIIILEYISDGLGYDNETKIPKMAEQAMYMHIAYSLVSTMPNIQEYVVRRFKQERRATLRNAKIRLQNIKLSEFVQVMRGKSKWIKH